MQAFDDILQAFQAMRVDVPDYLLYLIGGAFLLLFVAYRISRRKRRRRSGMRNYFRD